VLRQIEVGYEGGTVVRLTLDEESAQQLVGALEGGGWHRAEANEGAHLLNLDRAVYLRLEERPERIGFGGA
jgi:hypothetical protein